MNNIALSENVVREELFRATSQQTKLSPAIVEKDFWICWMLDYLFGQSIIRRQAAFKGGTSLSKAYALIRRMSEDIDIILDWRLLGYGLDEPWEERSNKKQRVFIDERYVPVQRACLEMNYSRKCNVISMPLGLRTSRSTSTPATRKPSCFPIHRPFPMAHCCRKYG